MPRQVDPKVKAEAFRLREQGLSARKISAQLGLSRGTLAYWFSARTRETTRRANHEYKRRRRAREGKPVDRVCSRCGATFAPTQGQQRRCASCRGKPAPKPTGRRKNPTSVKASKVPRPSPPGQISPTLAAKIDARLARRMAQADG